jgi:ubiquitin-conjugating enzyme E2 G1
MSSIKRLQSELKQLIKEPNYFFSVCPNDNNFYKWDVLMIGPPDCPFDGAFIKASIEFPSDYPNRPPKFNFISNVYHPNVYTDGKVCISILNEVSDENIDGYEQTSDRWNPSRSIDSVLMSIITMIAVPNFDSPANVDASVEWRNNFDSYKKKVYKMVAKSQCF